MKRKIFYSFLAIILLPLFSGCGIVSKQSPQSGLSPQGSQSQNVWNLPQAVKSQGEGNLYRMVTGSGLNAPMGLELAASGSGQLEYSVEATTGADVTASVRLQFLSTQGIGRLKLAAVDQEGREMATVGYIFTGALSPNGPRVAWTDKRYSANYTGDWLVAEYRPAQLLASHLVGVPENIVKAYRMTVEVGQGQHAIVTDFTLASTPERALAVKPVRSAFSTVYGETIRIEADVMNQTSRTIEEAVIALAEPYGYGLLVTEQDKRIESLKPGEKRRLVWEVKAARPDTVNLNKPWKADFTINGKTTGSQVEVAIADNRPGKIFYVMTEDLEGIDGAGYGTAWGNQNGWLDAEELKVQMVDKAEKLNAVAEEYGAKWTHYIAWPLVKAAQWAATQSTTGQWNQAVHAISQSVRNQASKGHEYGIHLHIDYDPYVPGNVLSYNSANDGLWANHLRHGWSHSLGVEGHFGDYASRAGTLYAYQRIMDELSADSAQGQLITARVGSFDFGAGRDSEAMSTRVYRKVGLWASSDADGNQGGITAGPYGREIYFAKPDDINTAAVDLKHTGIVEFRPTPQAFINYDSQSAATMNQLADEGVSFFRSPSGAVKPGVHGIVGFTHAMFVMGQGDWKSTEQGQFAVIGDHLQHLTNSYVSRGLLNYGTANELVKAWLDYYTPQLVALYGPRTSRSALGISEYAVELLGLDIPVDNIHRHTVTLKIPLYLRDSAYRAVVLKNGEPIYSTWGLPTPYNDIQFVVDDKSSQYTLKVYHHDTVALILRYIKAVKAKLLPGK